MRGFVLSLAYTPVCRHAYTHLLNLGIIFLSPFQIDIIYLHNGEGVSETTSCFPDKRSWAIENT